MQVRVHQHPGATWTVEFDIPAYTKDEIAGLVKEGAKAAGEQIITDALKEEAKKANFLKVSTAAKLMDIASVEIVRGYGKLPAKHPRHLPIIWGESSWGDKVRLVDLVAWGERNCKPDTKAKIAEYEAKHAKIK